MEYAFFKRKVHIFLIIGFILGVISGTILFNCLDVDSKNSLLIYYKYISRKMDLTDVNKSDYFFYVIKYRMK